MALISTDLVPDGVRICPACGDPQPAQVGGSASPFEVVAGGKVFQQPSYAIRRCGTCDLHFKSCTVSLSQLDEYYACLEFEPFDIDANFPTDNYLRRWLDQLPNGSRVLDFGCSTGRILQGVAARLNCFGVELNEASAAIARARGINVVTMSELSAGVRSEFDAILLTDVYEHLPQPVELLRTLSALLRPGGRLVIVTGNADAIVARDRIGEHWYFRILGHLQMLSERHAHWLAGRLGLRVQSVHRCSHYNLPLKVRFKQLVQSFAYNQFRSTTRRGLSALLRLLPLINRAEHWGSAPALSYRDDHLVAILKADD